MVSIKKLASLAGLSLPDIDDDNPETARLYLFVELIKLECASACNDFACGRTASPEDLINAHFVE